MAQSKIIALLVGLLGDLHYDSKDVAKYLKKRGYCLDCTQSNSACKCNSSYDRNLKKREREEYDKYGIVCIYCKSPWPGEDVDNCEKCGKLWYELDNCEK